MRYRKPNRYMEKLMNFENYIKEESASEHKGKWRSHFKNQNQQLMVEIGCGKGGFLLEQAQRNPQINYIGMERIQPLMLDALRWALDAEMDNILFCGCNANRIEEFIEEAEVDRLYLNFSDPWPKNRHAKRRLTSRRFLEKYSRILRDDKELVFKTDNTALFEFTLMELSQRGDRLKSIDIDLHSKEIDIQDERLILTEYEKKFIKCHLPIYRLEANLK